MDTKELIKEAYSAFNHRDIEGALSLMAENVSWPKASEGGRANGKAQIRTYWTHQWQQFAPTVEPIELIEREDGKTEVRVHQIVKSLSGEVLFDGEVWHVYTVSNSLIERMDLKEDEGTSASTPSVAFAGR